MKIIPAETDTARKKTMTYRKYVEMPPQIVPDVSEPFFLKGLKTILKRSLASQCDLTHRAPRLHELTSLTTPSYSLPGPALLDLILFIFNAFIILIIIWLIYEDSKGRIADHRETNLTRTTKINNIKAINSNMH